MPKENLPHGDVLILTECRLYDGVNLDPSFRLSRCYRFFLSMSKFFRTYYDELGANFYPESERYAGCFACSERTFRVLSESIVSFWNRYDYNRLVDFYQTLEDSNDKDLVDFELRNYSFRYNRSVRDKEKPYHELPLVRRLAAASLMKCRNKVKHKEINDSFGIFSYQD